MQEDRGRPSAYPGGGDNSKKSSIYEISKLIENIFSYRGLFFLGVAVAILCFVFNWSFWQAVIESLGYGFYMSFFIGFLISIGTSIFEVLPKASVISRRLKLTQIFAAAIKPRQLPEISKAIVPDAETLISEYKNGDRERRKFFSMMRYIAYGVETLMGIIFLGRLGTGFEAAVRLFVFIFSIIGVEWGVSLALRASEDELPPVVKQQLDQLIQGSDRPLSLKDVP